MGNFGCSKSDRQHYPAHPPIHEVPTISVEALVIFGLAEAGGRTFARDNATYYDNTKISTKRKDVTKLGFEFVLLITE